MLGYGALQSSEVEGVGSAYIGEPKLRTGSAALAFDGGEFEIPGSSPPKVSGVGFRLLDLAEGLPDGRDWFSDCFDCNGSKAGEGAFRAEVDLLERLSPLGDGRDLVTVEFSSLLGVEGTADGVSFTLSFLLLLFLAFSSSSDEAGLSRPLPSTSIAATSSFLFSWARAPKDGARLTALRGAE